MVDLLVLLTNLNHWLSGSHELSLLKHLQLLVTMVLLKPISRQTAVPLGALDDKCILESDIVSHFELESVHIIPSFAGFAKSSVCKQKYVPFTDSIFWGE